MTDPMGALRGLQQALDDGIVRMQSCELHPNLQMLFDRPNGRPRFTYAQIVRGHVQALALFAVVDPIQGVPCFQLGIAVVEAMRGTGIGKRVLREGIAELIRGICRTRDKEFFLEAIVSNDNFASRKIAEQLISDKPEPCEDAFSGQPSQQYLRKVDCGAASDADRG